ncbi:methylmalonyl-CoA mutase subunit beta [Spongiactinospora sp. TRM90649]|uniref:methylmalonyl-CoA mutase subunit beta n=1 Tax=Spongiactinospora sp. TRM90649 TaxID=3031114 RepID=UPI0023F745D2|nr:methylmalonyl-CoA mutase subunit beta [Spongiactinospora sp. TRM90649]MDF5758207.1 methylmalonyl-CoA mutase subunit beta [Spongiactinospora sp. TRM90649]
MTVPPQEYTTEELALAANFPAASRDEWREAALAVLRKSGAEPDDPEEALATTTYDGVRLLPLYDASDSPGEQGIPGAKPHTRGGRPLPGWDIRQHHAVADPEAVLADLENGVSSVWLTLSPGGITPADLPRVLNGVYLDLAPVVLDAGADTRAAAEALFAIAGGGGVSGNLGADPLGLAARTGDASEAAVARHTATAAELAARCVDAFPGLRALTVDATPYHDAGGSDAEELGCSIATGVAYLRALTDTGLSVEQALGQLEFRYSATADQFATIAKLRAARRMWDRVAEASGAGAGRGAAQRQHAVTSSAMMTVRDPWVNMLRTTLACFAAGVGGADAVTVQPFDACLGLPDGFARRIARNTQSLLQMEAHVSRVADPAGGSWYVERRTDDLARAAWAWFQEIEAAGGMARALRTGLVETRLGETWARRRRDIARRRAPITGVSEFPNIGEKPVVRAAAPAVSEGGLPRVRYAQDFEELRDLADARPERPSVFLATIGPVAAHTARATFAANLFQAGGLATPSAGPGTDPAAIAEGFARSGSPVACLCASDRLYGEHAAEVAAALRAAGARYVWLAGKGEHEGVDGNLYAGCDALGVLRTTFDHLGVSR